MTTVTLAPSRQVGGGTVSSRRSVAASSRASRLDSNRTSSASHSGIA